MRFSNIVEKPVITEKSFSLASQDKYVFKVNLKSAKSIVAKEIERLFGVDVVKIRTSISPGKRKRIIGTRNFTKTPKWKKATVQLKKGQSIDLVEAGEK
ncbi:50S ribosomal protein L23 [Patescibacteria group bacterium]|nr:50S ribosomal protein L23 [Patescibacteria group bacterium]